MESRNPQKLFMAAAVAAGTLVVPTLYEAAPVDAEAACVYVIPANSGQYKFELTTGLTVQAESKATGIPVDALFNRVTLPLSCDTPGAVIAENLGSTTSTSTTSPSETTKTTHQATTIPKTDQHCVLNVMSISETANLLGAPGKSGAALCALIFDFQRANKLKADGIVGMATAQKMINQSPNACNIYGSGVTKCFLGVEKTGYLGVLYTIENGKIIDTMPSRFGNPNLPKGQATPEGSFKINRSIKGPRVSSLCIGGLACMRNPLYFAGNEGGISIHGTNNPQSPAGSHGCVGISNSNSEKTYEYYDKDGIRNVIILDLQRATPVSI